MNTPYYFTTDDRTTRTFKLYTTNLLEPTEETRTLVMKFRYTNQSASHVYIRLFNFMTDRMKKTGGCHLFQAWEEALAVDVSTDEGMLMTGAMQSDIYPPIKVPFNMQSDREKLQKELNGFKSGLALKFQYLDRMSVAYKDQPEMFQRYIDGMKHDRRLIDEWTQKLEAHSKPVV